MAAAIKTANPSCACCVKIRCFDDTQATVALACMLQVRHSSPASCMLQLHVAAACCSCMLQVRHSSPCACMLQVHVADTLAVVGRSILSPTASSATFKCGYTLDASQRIRFVHKCPTFAKDLQDSFTNPIYCHVHAYTRLDAYKKVKKTKKSKRHKNQIVHMPCICTTLSSAPSTATFMRTRA